ncbi:MAG: phage tail protein [Sedimenticola sp.]
MYCAEVANSHAKELLPHWLPLEGQKLVNASTEYPELYQALVQNTTLEPDGSTNILLPDFRGRFLRECLQGEFPGQKKDYLTALPKKTPIAFNSKGAHSHSFYSGTELMTSDHCAGHANACAGERVECSAAGSHKHEVTGGGDLETRPVSLYIDFLLRVSNPSTSP